MLNTAQIDKIISIVCSIPLSKWENQISGIYCSSYNRLILRISKPVLKSTSLFCIDNVNLNLTENQQKQIDALYNRLEGCFIDEKNYFNIAKIEQIITKFDLRDIVDTEQVKSESSEEDQLWASVIFDATFYDGTPHGLQRLIAHLKKQGYLISKKSEV